MHIKKRYVLYIIFTLSLTLVCLKSNSRFYKQDSVSISFTKNHGIINGVINESVTYPACKEPLYLLIENPHINKVILKNHAGSFIETGDFFPFNQRKLPFRFFILPLNNDSTKGQALLTLNKSGENLFYSVSVFTNEQLRKYLLTDQLLVGVITGIYLLAILLSFFRWWILKTYKHLFFFLYILFSIGWILNDAGIFYQELWPNNPSWHNASRSFFTSISMFLFLLYIQKNEDLKLRKRLYTFTIIIIGLLTVKLFFSLLSVFNLLPDQYKLVTLNLNAYLLLLLFGGILSYLGFKIKYHKENIYEILAIQTYCVFIVTQAAKELGYLHLNVLSLHQFETIVFFPIQSAFMSVHLYKVEKERRATDRELLVKLKTEHQKEINKKIIEVEEAEKKRIAQNIHDSIGSIFAAIKYRLLSIKHDKKNKTADEIENLIKLTNEGIRKQYKLIDELLIDLNQENALKKAIYHYSELLISKEIVDLKIDWSGNERLLTDYQKSQLFHIIIELITNTNKHAKASLIKINFEIKNKIFVSYSDNGIGFNQHTIKTGRGLANIKLRLDSIEGDFSILSNQNGTLINIKFPLK